MTDAQYMRYLTGKKKRLENYWTPKMFKALQAQKEPVVAALYRGGPELATITVELISNQPVKDVLRAIYLSVGPKEAEWQYNLLNKIPVESKKGYLPGISTKAPRAGAMGIDYDFQTDITEYLNRNVLNQVTVPMDEVTKQRILRELVSGVTLGESYEKIVARILSKEMDAKRARLIVRTELNRAVNAAHNIGRTAYPYEVEKVWLSSQDKRTRGADRKDKSDHLHMNGQTVGEDDEFKDPISKSELLFPGDSTLGAGAKDVCNCRCNVRFNPKRDVNGRLVLRKPGPPPARPAKPPVLPPPPVAKPVPTPKPMPEPPKPVPTPVQMPDTPTIVANRIKDKLKERYGLNFKEPAVSDKMTVDQLRRYETQIDNLAADYNIYSGYRSNEIKLVFKSTSSAYGRLVTMNDGSILDELNFGSRSDSDRSSSGGASLFRNKSRVDFINQDVATVTHEFAHFISIFQQAKRNNDENVNAFWPELRKLKTRYTKELKGYLRNGEREEAQSISLGNYASTNLNEFMAEAFTEYKLLSSPSKFAVLVGQLIDKYFLL